MQVTDPANAEVVDPRGRLLARRTACLIAALGLFGTLDSAASEMLLRWQPPTLELSGSSSSHGHQQILQRVARERFADAELRFDVFPSPLAPPGWSLVTEQTLLALAGLAEGEASVSVDSVTISGTWQEPAEWLRARRSLERALLPGMRLVDETGRVSPPEMLREGCRTQFAAIVGAATITFRSNDDRLSPAARPHLDALAELAADCRGARLKITGHTDGAGDAEFNQRLSERRARAVRDYLVARGVAADRLDFEGAGASAPLVPGDTRVARQRNRRIEIELFF